MKGASIKDAQELLGHKTMKMTLRYAHLSEDHKKKAVNLLNELTAPREKFLSHFVANAAFEPSEKNQMLANPSNLLEPMARIELATY